MPREPGRFRLRQLTWEPGDAGRAVEALVLQLRWTQDAGVSLPRAEETRERLDAEDTGRDVWDRLEATALHLGCEIQGATVNLGDLENSLRSCGPALMSISWPGDENSQLLAVVACRFGRVSVLTPSGRKVSVGSDRIARALSRPKEKPFLPRVDRIVESLSLDTKRAARVRSSLLERQLAQVEVGPLWLLRPSRGLRPLAELKNSGLMGEFVIYLASYVAGYGLLLASWWALGRGALGGRFDRNWLLAWALLLVSLMAPRLLSVWTKSRISISLGTILKKRLLEGILRTDPQKIRHQGAGQLLGRVLESEAVEHYLLQGGFLTLAGGVELLFSMAVLAFGAGGRLHTAALVGWCAVIAWFAVRHYRDRRAWTLKRLKLTHEMVESTVGHRTRLVQLNPGIWHAREDAMLNDYVRASSRLDGSQVRLMSFAPRGWILIGFAGLIPAFVSSTTSVASVAIALGGVLTAFRGFSKVSEGFGHLANAWIAWTSVQEIVATSTSPALTHESSPFDLANPTQHDSDSDFDSDGDTDGEPPPIVQGRRLVFRREGRPNAILDGVELTIRKNERWLLQGASGCGKSTLASVIAADLEPQQGLLLLHGLDLPTWTEDSWRRRIVLVPQFHENHLYTGSMAFNLLLGRRWPAAREDLLLAEEVCAELGLDKVIGQMPAGLQQPVGETGWQLSHGERSRVFLARALLQQGDLLILDETLAGLDPATSLQVLNALNRREGALLVIAHP